MRITINKSEIVPQEIDIDFPYYYKHNLSDRDESIIYGKLDIGSCCTIHVKKSWVSESVSVEIEVERYEGVPPGCYHSYFSEEFKATAVEFRLARDLAQKFLDAAFTGNVNSIYDGDDNETL